MSESNWGARLLKKPKSNPESDNKEPKFGIQSVQEGHSPSVEGFTDYEKSEKK